MTESEPLSMPVLIDDKSTAVPIFASFEDFYSTHNRSIFEALVLTLSNEELARDAAAEGMARAFQRWGQVGPYSNPAGWVYRVGLNWATSRLRKFRREVSRDVTPDHAAEPVAEIDPRLDAAIAELSVDQRAVVVLRYHLDWSEAATAEALEIPPGTVKSRLSRALDRLATTMKES